MNAELTQNDFLNGLVTLWQPKDGYRAGVDPVLLAATIPAKAGARVLELGSGAGAAFLCLAKRVPNLVVHAVELQPDYAALAHRNAKENGVDATIWEADLAALPIELRQMQFDHVFANPPYFDRAASTAAQDAGRDVAMGEDTPLDTWVEVAAKRLAAKGTATFVHRAERLLDLLSAMQGVLGSVQVMPLQPRVGRDANLVLVRGVKGGRAAFRLHAPVRMHEGDVHTRDGESYTDQIRAVLRDGAALSFP
ncbi:tRNA1(Val) (adenine(37)-N6)-methyltransferase [Shimia sagamensis]|uniref:tRNA1(Val) A37 N6-methylase TrmN6 n=1 Tax=Shimia sagamensis TaxID=1566352 RepID=A0ABY1PAZ6_9RHOB|nr:methyltransferase [Shimia sagamensis]SMP29509.1 tRNA1(Val) A37 N6-methylase TrmN6 [Shimia sagamensis]